jgi:hypothetical protein
VICLPLDHGSKMGDQEKKNEKQHKEYTKPGGDCNPRIGSGGDMRYHPAERMLAATHTRPYGGYR